MYARVGIVGVLGVLCGVEESGGWSLGIEPWRL